MIPQVRQTKFLLVVAVFIVAAVALFIGRCTFGEWATFMGTLFALYGVADVTNTHLQQTKNIRPEDQTA